MEAMILAAGRGTRLRPLTDHLPKALVDVAGQPILERVANRLIEAGATRLIINVHHHADQVESFVRERGGFGVDVALSREEGEDPLETGGGLLHARSLFRSNQPFLVHNVDIVTDVDLRGLWSRHMERRPLATLAVHHRETSRPLLFDDIGLYGRNDNRPGRESRDRARDPVGKTRSFAFAGIHVLDPRIFDLIEERGAFSIMTVYFRLAEDGEVIRGEDVGAALWLEIGNPERLARARRLMEEADS